VKLKKSHLALLSLFIVVSVSLLTFSLLSKTKEIGVKTPKQFMLEQLENGKFDSGPFKLLKIETPTPNCTLIYLEERITFPVFFCSKDITSEELEMFRETTGYLGLPLEQEGIYYNYLVEVNALDFGVDFGFENITAFKSEVISFIES